MKEVFILSAVRTPIGKYGGVFSSIKAKELGIIAAAESIKKAGLIPDSVDEAIFGCARQAGIGPNISRQIAVGVGIPSQKTAYTINKACGSGLKSIINAYTSIVLGDNDVVLAGGVESMSNIPYLLTQARWGYRMGNSEILDANHTDGYFCPMADKLMGATVEDLALKYNISRDEQDAFALQSQLKAESAIKTGKFNNEIIPVKVATKKGDQIITTDEHPRIGATIEDLKKLKPAFKKDGTITAGSSSGVTDGASALIIAGKEFVQNNNLKPLARIIGYSSAGVNPSEMGIAPVPTVQKLLSKTNLRLNDIDLIELNEAFAAQVLACDRELHFDKDKVNVHGGAIALGHPTGCTGARITTTLIHSLHDRKAKLGIATLCISGGLGLALLVERV